MVRSVLPLLILFSRVFFHFGIVSFFSKHDDLASTNDYNSKPIDQGTVLFSPLTLGSQRPCNLSFVTTGSQMWPTVFPENIACCDLCQCFSAHLYGLLHLLLVSSFSLDGYLNELDGGSNLFFVCVLRWLCFTCQTLSPLLPLVHFPPNSQIYESRQSSHLIMLMCSASPISVWILLLLTVSLLTR
jgi:hypothetical protein